MKGTQRTTPSKQSQTWIITKGIQLQKNTSNNTGNTQAKIACPCTKVNAVFFEDSYDHINPTENTYEDTHIIGTQYQDIKDDEVEQEELFGDTNDNLITEEELEHIHPDLNKTVPSPTMNSGLMTVNHNNPEKFIDNTEDFCQYRSWLLSGHEGNIIHQTTTKVITEKLYEVSNSHVFTDITIFTYTRPVKCNVQILNGRKYSANGFGLVKIKIPKTNITIPLWPSYYIT